jgi:hypothetical protein
MRPKKKWPRYKYLSFFIKKKTTEVKSTFSKEKKELAQTDFTSRTLIAIIWLSITEPLGLTHRVTLMSRQLIIQYLKHAIAEITRTYQLKLAVFTVKVCFLMPAE